MRWRDAAEVAWDALRVHRLRTRLTLLAIAIGVTAVLVLTALGDAAKRYVLREFASAGTNLVVVSPGRVATTGTPAAAMGGATRDLTLDDAEALRTRCPAALEVVPLTIGSAPIAWGGRVRNVMIAGVTPNFIRMRHLEVASGQFLPAGDVRHGAGVVVIGSTIARELFRGENPLGQAVRIARWRFRVIGVLAPRGRSLGMDFDDEALLPVATSLRLFDRSGLFHIMVQARDPMSVDAAAAQMRSVLRERHDGDEDFTVQTQDAMLRTFGNVIDALTAALAGIAAISLAVAGIGIMNVMLVSVSERTREIGLLKALGARRRQILSVFLAEAILLSAMGAALGTGVGVVAVWIGARIWRDLPLEPSALWVAIVTLMALAFGAVFGLLPARRAARMPAADALRGAR